MVRLMRLSLPALQYAPLTFPTYSGLLTNGNTLAVGASLGLEPVGLALATLEAGRETATLRSIAVAPEHRGKGLGTQLLAWLEDELPGHCHNLEAVLTDKTSSFEVIRHMLERRQWNPPQRRMMICRSNLETILKAPWMHNSYLTEEFTIFPWKDLTKDEELDLRQHRHFRYPPILSPFLETQPFEPVSSLGLRYGGQVVGWLVTHVIPPDILRFTSMYVRTDLQKRGRAVSLLIESMRRYKTQPIAKIVPKGIYNIHIENRAMYEFAERRLVPYMTEVYYSYWTTKALHRAVAAG